MSNIITIKDSENRSGRVFTFDLNSKEIKDEIQRMILRGEQPSLIINTIKNNNLGSVLDYKIIGVDNAADTIAFYMDDGKINIPIIDRKYEPKGFALPGGFVDEGESFKEASIRELKEELNISVVGEPIFETQLYSGLDDRGDLYDPRGQVRTQGFVFEIPSNIKISPSSDAKGYKILTLELNNIDDVMTQISKMDFAMDRHKLILMESIKGIEDLIFEKELSIDMN